jgi:uncharacterized membrane protein YphA (DoxX/SURF4 family)
MNHRIGTWATSTARALLGLLFFVLGLNKLLHFIPQPPAAGAAAVFAGGLAASHYFFPLLAVTEITAGAALLVRRYVPLALTVLAPIVVNIVGFHLFLAPGELPVAIVVLGLELFLAWSYRASFRTLLRAHDEDVVTGKRARTAPVAHAS